MNQNSADNPTSQHSQPAAMGIYVHIPFCQHKCLYCDFYSIERMHQMGDFVTQLIQEIELRAQEGSHSHIPVRSIFFGGGTPSLLAPEQMQRIAEALQKHFAISAESEWTMECNPGTVTAQSLRSYRESGVNRLSFGVQSFVESELHFLERIHSPEQAEEAVALARDAGFENINIDLMFALPGQTEQSYAYTMQRALALGTEHISAYSLIYEEGTPLYTQWQKGLVAPRSEEEDSRLYEYTMQLLAEHGYKQYEVSNFAQPGRECRHNLLYWQAGEYLAFGPSAHGYRSGQRYWNYRNLGRYLESLSRNTLPIANSEELNVADMLFERAFLELRSQGIHLQRFRQDFGIDILKDCHTLCALLLREEFVYIEKVDSRVEGTGEGIREHSTNKMQPSGEERLRLSHKGYMVCDEISLRLISALEERTQRQWQPTHYTGDTPEATEDEQSPLLPILGVGQ